MQALTLTGNELGRLSEVFFKCISTKTVDALSMLLGEPVRCSVGKIRLYDFAELDELTPAFADSEDMSAVYLRQSGDIQVGVLYYMPKKEGKRFAARLLGKKRFGAFTKLEQSSLSETGNILSGSFFGALAKEQNCKTNADVPGFAVDTFKSLLEFQAVEIGITSQSLIACSAEFHSESDLKLRMLIILDPANAKKLLVKC